MTFPYSVVTGLRTSFIHISDDILTAFHQNQLDRHSSCNRISIIKDPLTEVKESWGGTQGVKDI